MKLKYRAAVFLSGIAVVFLGLAKYQQFGAFPYLNWQKQPVFPLAIVAAGLVLSVLACFPQRWVGRWIGIRSQRNAHVLTYLDEHQHRHKSHSKQT